MDTLNKNAKGYNYKYTDLAEIHSYLESKGLSYYQFVDVIDGNDYVMTVKVDKDGKESTPIRGCRVVQATLSGNSNPAQEQGSALSYARRYSLLLAYGLCTSDDDAEMLSRRPKSSDKDVLKSKILTFVGAWNLDANKVFAKAKIKGLDELPTERLDGMLNWLNSLDEKGRKELM
jgi:hypothetical protein